VNIKRAQRRFGVCAQLAADHQQRGAGTRRAPRQRCVPVEAGTHQQDRRPLDGQRARKGARTLPGDHMYTSERISTTRGGPTEDPGVWAITHDGRAFRWEGFYTGPRFLDHSSLAAATQQLLGIELDQVPSAAARVLRPYVGDGHSAPAIILHSATPGLRSLEADLSDAQLGRTPDDVATYVEARAVSLARPGDIVVGRTEPWRLAAELAGIDLVTIPGIDFYYLSQAIIRLALDSHGQAPELARLAKALRDRPDTLVRLYALDREIQVVLLFLARMAGIEEVRTDANSPQVAETWNAKAPLYPAIEDATAITAAVTAEPHELLAAETELAPLRRRLGVQVPVLPGYSIDAGPVDEAAFGQQLAAAGRLLRERYGLSRGCLKPSEAGAGARIVLGVALGDEDGLRELAARAWRSREAYVLEAHVEYLRRPVTGGELRLAPSGHIRHGHVAEGLTLQLTSGTSWRGNVFLDEQRCATLGLTLDRYHAIVDGIEELHAAFTEQALGLVTAGFDFAVGRVGGRFGDEVILALQDPNMSSHGAEYLRHFIDDVHAAGGPRYAATKVICPAPGYTLEVLRALEAERGAPDTSRVISAIPGRWGMIAVAADTPLAATEEILRRDRDLRERSATLSVEAR
jgi:hypothetical protein